MSRKHSVLKQLEDKYGEEVLSISISGSYAANLETTRSDFDMIFLVDQNSKLHGNVGNYISTMVDGVLAEILIIEQSTISDYVKKIHSRSILTFRNDELLNFEKIFSAKPTFKKDIWKRVLKDFDRKHYEQQMTMHHWEFARHHYLDFCGEFSTERELSAVHNLRAVLYQLIECMFCVFGDTNGRHKWVVQRTLTNNAIPNFIKENFLRFFLEFSDTDNARDWLKRCSRFCQVLAWEVRKNTLQNDSTQADIVDEPGHNGGSTLVSHDHLMIFEVGDNFIIITPDEDMVLDNASAMVLSIFSIERTIESAFNTIRSISAFSEISLGNFQRISEGLLDAGLLKKYED